MIRDIEVCCSCRALLTSDNSTTDFYCNACISEFNLEDEIELPTYAQTGNTPINEVQHDLAVLRRNAVGVVRGDMWEAHINPNKLDAMEAFSRLQLICGRDPDLIAANYLNFVDETDFANFSQAWQQAKRAVCIV